jgi:hypothetical protein
VDRAGWEEWKIEIPARREKKVKGGGGGSTAPSTPTSVTKSFN